jgi:putative drug exporter of the RND superfamily
MPPRTAHHSSRTAQPTGPLARLARFTVRRRWPVIALWIVATAFGAFASGRLASRWDQGYSAPGQPAYDAGRRAVDAVGAGARPPVVVVFRAAGDATRSAAIEAAMARAAAEVPGAATSSVYSTGSLAYASRDRHTTFLELYPPGPNRLDAVSGAERIRAAAARGLPAGIAVEVTGRDPLEEASRSGTKAGSGLLVEAGIGAVGALVILLFVFGTLPAVLMPVAAAIAAVLNTFALVWGLTYVTDVSIIVQFLIALVGLGVAIDYALLIVFRFRDELRAGVGVEEALVATVTHAGRAVIVSGSTVAIGLVALIAVPVPMIRSLGIGGMLIPAVSVLAALTLLPATLAVLGERINRVRVLPRRLLDRGHPEQGAWGRWARFVLRRPFVLATAGLAVVVALAGFGLQLAPREAPLSDFPGTGSAIAGRQLLADAGISPGVMKPLDVLVEDGVDPDRVAATLRTVPGITAATAPAAWRHGPTAMVEAFPAMDGSAAGMPALLDRVDAALAGTGATVTGPAAIDQAFLDALFGSLPWVLGAILLATLVLLTRAFRSPVLALKAVVVNLLSLAAAFGTVVLVFQHGFGASLWGVPATESVIAWVPMIIFAFLFGLSMDYEVFILSRIREAYDETGSTERAVELGLARVGKLVTSGALILMFAFLVLSTSPGYEIKPISVGLAAGIIVDATIVRALLVPALIRLCGAANWWMPAWLETTLRVPGRVPSTPAAPTASAERVREAT